MKDKKLYLLFLSFIICILSISAISATENTVNTDVISTDNNKYNNLETNIQYDEVSTSKENSEINIEENNNNDKESESETDKITTDNEGELTFTDLNTTINDNTNSTVYLSNNYKYEDSDSNFQDGIIINRDLTIYGNGVTLDGSNKARIFKVENNINVKFYDIIFINGQAELGEAGGAIYGGNAYNCTFKNNNAFYGGAIYQGNAFNCTFTENKDTSDISCGGAINQGNATNCIFTENKAAYGGAIYNGTAYNCNFTNNRGEYGGAINLVNAYNCTFTENTASNYGGAAYNVTVYNCTFIKNEATGYEDQSGGTIYQGNATNCTFTENKAEKNGGAIYDVNAYNCEFTNNNATYGGAMYYGDAINCIFTNNNALNGGALYQGNATNSTFANNLATGEDETNGGAIYQGNAFNCIFTNHRALNGGALYQTNATNCIFIANDAAYGGAMYDGDAINCTFINNIGQGYGAAMYGGNAILCIFENNTCDNTNIIPVTINVLNYISPYSSGESLKFNLTANDRVLDGFNTAIKIYKDGEVIKTVYALTGEGWVVDLDVGEYIAELSLTDFPDEKSTNATIEVSKANTTVVIDPIIDAIVGKEIKVKYTTNSKGNVTIKVNGKVIIDGIFKPTAVGTYNLIVEIAETENYTAGSNETTFTVGKAGSKITVKPVTTTYNVGKYLIITLKDQNGNAIKNAVLTVNLGSAKNYKTDKNGQIKINVATLIPKTYNAKITYAGSNNYNGSTSSVKVTVKKATPKITAKSTIYKLRVKTKKYTASFKTNKNQALKNTKVALKVQGKTYIAKTNSRGQATFKITNLNRKGTYTTVITVPTNKYYNQISKKVKIAVKG